MTSEFALLSTLRPLLAGDGRGVVLGMGDDAAVVEIGGVPVALALDSLVDEVHFDLTFSSLSDVGWKSLAVNVSDLAAIGAHTSAAVVGLQRPDDFDEHDALSVYDGLQAAAREWRVHLVGGDIVRGPALALTVAVIGAVTAPILRRSGARLGDRIVVVGPLGEAAAGLALHRAGADGLLGDYPELSLAHRRPRALPEVGVALAAVGAHACIDVSDGLGQDAGHVAEDSGVRIRLFADRLPVSEGVAAAAEELRVDPLDLVCGGGEDFALVAALAPDDLPALEERLEPLGVPWRDVGEVLEGEGVVLVGPDGTERDASRFGYEHGRAPS